MEPASPNARERVSKRSSNACARCRRQKIKCSGIQPCGSCVKRQLPCEFDYRDQRIVVSRGYIMDLEKSIEEAEQRGLALVRARASGSRDPGALQHGRDSVLQDTGRSGHARAASDVASNHGQGSQPRARGASQELAYPTPAPGGPECRGSPRHEQRDNSDRESSAIDNPLALRHPEFTTSAEGTSYYLGTSSNWSFTRRVLSLTHEHVYHTPLSPQSLLFDGAVYNIDWSNSDPGTHNACKAMLPTLDHAMYLISTVKFACGKLFHLFDDEEFTESCREFYADPRPDTSKTNLWYTHFYLVMALGQALQSRQRQERLPYGYELFYSTFQNLPSMGVLMTKPIVGIEILCCAALYLHCIDHRHYAYTVIGDAMRIALFQGLHIDMPTLQLGDRHVERCRRAWWTLYVLDHEMTLLMGLPMAIRESDVTCPLPHFSSSGEKVATMDMQVKLYRILANANEKLYGNSAHSDSLSRDYTTRAKETLEEIAELSDELRTSFPLYQGEVMSGVSRIASHLHLMYHRCIIIVTRPLLLALLKHRFSSFNTYLHSLNSMRTARNLIHMCIDSSQRMVSILDCLLNQGLISPFLHYDMEAVFVASTPLILGPVIDPQLPNGNRVWMRKAYAIFDDMITSGNRVAGFRKAELQHLDEVARLVTASDGCGTPRGEPEAHSGITMLDSVAAMESGAGMELGEDVLSWDCWLDGLTKESILDLAESITDDDMAWMYDTVVVHDA